MLNTVSGNLLDVDTKYIAHQCNCVTWVSAHLAKSVFTKFPYANIYKPRQGTSNKGTPGDIIICGDGVDKRYVIALLGQYYPGSPRYPTSQKDGFQAREEYFRQCLVKVAQIEDLDSIAFPYMVGCGAAGGNWQNYKMMIKDFSEKVNANVVIVRLEQ